ncbi:NADP-dependent oxidoreductase [Phytoactinopolyspora alkaliphila]|uniref:NADP-dependent oxidoreductase n=1 Tax=Phytoactinopolyspora alkaliphila TaxID=1783498 RepID=A0A6N9YPC1_9ACTN|nr:NADP-dependent oxidoreductase [Phytoactinopolyspora alkaliphila]NED96780.1 NADP-dependent oxidoreductase [Phytoactinopolyspora alkaliphila]
MRAIRMHEYGDASVIRLEEVPRPVPGPEEALIRVAATSFNPSEVGLRSGFLRSVIPVEFPYTLGWDASGVVTELGTGVSAFAAGDHVIGRVDTGGAAAEYVTVRTDTLTRAPVAVPLAQAAAIPLAGLTAWQAVFEHARISPGQSVFINGAGGGVGGFAVQLAKHAGAHVIATGSRRSAATLRRLGADEIVDYTVTALDDALDSPVDAVLNLVATEPELAAGLVTLVRAGGIVVSVTVPIESPDPSVRTVRFVARNDTTQLAELVGLLDAGNVRIDVAATLDLADLASVHRDSEAGRLRGKIILTP